MSGRAWRITIDPSSSVAEILRRHPEVAPVLARMGLDACRGGKHPLEFACRAHGIALPEVLQAMGAVSSPPATGASDTVEITCEMTVKDVIERQPATAAVFARNGLMGCGGSTGPDEPLGWFAHVHNVRAGRTRELLQALPQGGCPPRVRPGRRVAVRK